MPVSHLLSSRLLLLHIIVDGYTLDSWPPLTSNRDYGLYTTNKFRTTRTRWDLLCKIPHIHKLCYYICFVAWLERCFWDGFVGWWWFMLVGVGGNMWFHYLWACWEGQKHWSNLRECRWEYRSYNGFSWYCILYIANVLIVCSQLNSMTFGFLLEIGWW